MDGKCLLSEKWMRSLMIIGASLLLGGQVQAGMIKGGEGTEGVYQGHRVSGTVTSALDGSGLPGVNVVVKGTTEGTITDIDGKYSLEVPGGDAVLVFSYVGYNTEEVSVNGRSVVDVELTESVESLNEVVVTALGIKREERSLGFSVGRVEGKELTRVVHENVLNSMAGKIPGVTISSTGGTGSSVSMVIRGAYSLNTDNQPLFVVDGVPVHNSLNNTSQFGERNIVDYGNPISDLNPDDIESISILKGPSAAALYGSRAGNGVVLITTKSGKKSKGVTVSFNTNTAFDIPYKYLKVQHKFASGFFSFTPSDFPDGKLPPVDPAQAAGAGPELDKGYVAVQWQSPKDENGKPIPIELVSYPDNVANFVQTAITSTNGIAVSNSNDIMNFRLGFTNMSSRGLVPKSDMFRNNLSLSASVKVHKKVTVSTNVNVNRTWSNSRPSSNRGTNPLEWAYKVPQNIDIRLLKDYWEPGFEGIQQRTTWMGDPSETIYNNPYFLANEVKNSFLRDRVYGNLKLDWQISDHFSMMVRYGLDYYTERRETKIAPSYTREPNNGTYGLRTTSAYERNVDGLFTYDAEAGSFALSLSAGGNASYRKGSGFSNSSSGGLIIPNVYTVGNIRNTALNYGSSWSQKAIYSVYGIANISWKDMVYLDLTARNDWSSTLPAGSNSYFYPSVSLSLLMNEMFHMGDAVNMLKLRGGWAQVGNDTGPYRLYPTYGNAGQWGGATQLAKSGTVLLPELKPEIQTSWEFGLDLGMYNNRLRFEGTYYTLDNRNQILPVEIPSSTGFESKLINAGLIESKGWELMVGGTPVSTASGWSWDVSVNVSRNRTKILELTEGVDVVRFWSDAKGGAWTYVGEEVGNLYDAKMIVVEDENSPYYGFPIIGGSDFEWQAVDIDDVPPEERNKIGNFNPNFILGAQTTLAWKGISLNMTFDWRNGGQYISQTYRYTTEDASSQIWLDQAINPGGRTGKELEDWLLANKEKYILNGFHIVGGPTVEYGGFPESFSGITVHDGYFVPGVVAVDDGEGGVTYVPNLGNNNPIPYLPYVVSYPWSFAKASMFDADYVKLREISLSYALPHRLTSKGGFQSVTFSVYSRNIVLWTKGKNGIDPERAFQAESSGFKQGIERYNVDPWVLPVGVKIGLVF